MGFVIFALILFSSLSVFFVSYGKSYSDIENVPYKKMALVLGTSKYVSGDDYNLFYHFRIEAANELIQNNKVDYLLLSGAKDGLYNEPEKMKEDLLKRGVSENKILLDYKGFRTWDSVIRVKEVFGENDFIIVSQQFHIQRALFIASLNDIEARAYIAKNPPVYQAFRTYVRELFARVKLIFDVIFQVRSEFEEKKVVEI